MKGSRFGEAQNAYALRRAEENVAIGAVCQSTGILEATFYTRWKK